jgi:interferon, gamma-inducible protein 30
MKTILFIALILALASTQKVAINLYYESLCPYCEDFITGTFKDAINTPDFNTICDYNFFPYGKY